MVVSRWYGGTNLGIDNSSILVKRRYWETGAIGGRSCISCSYIYIDIILVTVTYCQ